MASRSPPEEASNSRSSTARAHGQVPTGAGRLGLRPTSINSAAGAWTTQLTSTHAGSGPVDRLHHVDQPATQKGLGLFDEEFPTLLAVIRSGTCDQV